MMTAAPRSATRVFVSVASLVVLASGCATNPRDQAGDPPPRTAPSTHSSTVAAGPIPTVDKPDSDQMPLPWQLDRIDAAQNRVYLMITGQGCSSPQGVALNETPATITITALGSKPPTAACTAQLTTIVGYVTPHDPIGKRRLVHGR